MTGESPEPSRIIVDSFLNQADALKQNPDMIAPREIMERQRVLSVVYLGFDRRYHKGQIVVDVDVADDVKDAFKLMRERNFPITSVIPISDDRFKWNDEVSMQANNSSGFNFRYIARTERLSNHSRGRAIDINPRINPYIKSDFVQPEGAVYNPSQEGVITEDHFLVRFFEERGWQWGGKWEDRKDYQHFENLL